MARGGPLDSRAPQAIVATKYRTNGDPASGIARTRPLCPYPQVARYKGTGRIDVAASFACGAPSP
jgi:feruloyl esterase